MKKVYSAPQILFESFVMSTNIAGDCEEKTNLPSNTTCGVEFSDGSSVFMVGMTGCETFKVEASNGDGEWNGLCYHVPNNEYNLFNS